MKKFGLIINPDRKGASIVGKGIIEWCLKKGCMVYMEEMVARMIGEDGFGVPESELIENVDFIVALGGDGTLLHAAHLAIEKEIPILGVNLGSLGFITQMGEDEVYEKLDAILRGEFDVERRMVVEGKILGRDLPTFFGLNEISLNMGSTSRVITIKIFIEDEYLGRYSADGVLVATPTGSTAYSLSAGGPILNPEMDALVLTPICPHTLAIRPMIIPPSHKIKVVIEKGASGMILTIDGQKTYPVLEGDQILFNMAKKRVYLVKTGVGFYELVRRRLGWGGLGSH